LKSCEHISGRPSPGRIKYAPDHLSDRVKRRVLEKLGASRFQPEMLRRAELMSKFVDQARFANPGGPDERNDLPMPGRCLAPCVR